MIVKQARRVMVQKRKLVIIPHSQFFGPFLLLFLAGFLVGRDSLKKIKSLEFFVCWY